MNWFEFVFGDLIDSILEFLASKPAFIISCIAFFGGLLFTLFVYIFGAFN